MGNCESDRECDAVKYRARQMEDRIAILTEELRREREFRRWEREADTLALYVLTCSKCRGEFLIKRDEEPYRTTRVVVGKILEAMRAEARRKAEARRHGGPVPAPPGRNDPSPVPDGPRPDPEDDSGEEPHRLSDLVPGGR